VIGAELRLKTIRRVAERSRHDSCIGDDDVKGLATRLEFVSAGANPLEIGQIERDQLEAATIGRASSHFRSRSFRLPEIPRRSCDLCAVRRQSPRGLDSETRGHAGNQNPFALKIDSFQNLVCS
jgi:hypothetical protein